MDVEGDFFRGGGPVFVGEAVEEFAVGVGVEGMVAGGGGALVNDVVAVGVLDLWVEGGVSQCYPCSQMNVMVRTQKSTSRLPAPPNSLSPTWKVTVILSSLCSCSWKHSREWAPRLMLWAAAMEERRRIVDASTARMVEDVVGRRMVERRKEGQDGG